MSRRLPSVTSRLVLLMVTAVTCVAISGCRQSWHGELQTTRVVDSETRAGVAGAIVVVSWEVQASHGYPAGYVEVQESLSDRDGVITIQPWGPVVKWLSGVRMPARQPQLRILADDYCPVVIYNESPTIAARIGDVSATGLPDEIALTRADRPGVSCQSGYAEVIDSMTTLAYIGLDCGWMRVPRMVEALDRAAKLGKYDPQCVRFGQINRLPRPAGCPNPEKYFGVQTK